MLTRSIPGNDTIDGKGGADLLFGGQDNDTLTASAAATGATFSGGKGNDTLILVPSARIAQPSSAVSVTTP